MRKKSQLHRLQLQSILLYGEGPTDEAFLHYLGGLYCPRGCGKLVRYDNAHGGGADGAAKKAMQAHGEIPYSRKLLLLDGDTKLSSPRRDLLIGNRWVIFVPEPCVEGLFLDIREPRRSHATWSTPQCKREFYQKYLDEGEAMDYLSYKGLFSKSVIEKASKQLAIMGKILQLLQS